MICTWNDATSARKKEAHVMVEQVIKQELNEEDEALRAKVCACIPQVQSYPMISSLPAMTTTVSMTPLSMKHGRSARY